MRVFNAIGEAVTTLVNVFKEAGNYEVSFHATELTSGVYYFITELKPMISPR